MSLVLVDSTFCYATPIWYRITYCLYACCVIWLGGVPLLAAMGLQHPGTTSWHIFVYSALAIVSSPIAVYWLFLSIRKQEISQTDGQVLISWHFLGFRRSRSLEVDRVELGNHFHGRSETVTLHAMNAGRYVFTATNHDCDDMQGLHRWFEVDQQVPCVDFRGRPEEHGH